MTIPFRPRPWLGHGLIACAFLLAAACGAGRDGQVASNMANPDRFLYERGQAALKEEKWLDAREYFRQVVDNYPQSPLRPDAKLGVGDAYIGEKGSENFVLAANEFREFLTYYPQNPRADYAQYRLAMSHFMQMRAPDRDQTETREALEEFQAFFTRFPNSPLAPEVRKAWREARDRLSEHNYRVGYHYFRIRWYPGAVDRFREVLKDDPEFTHRDKVYFHMAESILGDDKTRSSRGAAEALPYFEKLLAEFPVSEYRVRAEQRVKELKTS